MFHEKNISRLINIIPIIFIIITAIIFTVLHVKDLNQKFISDSKMLKEELLLKEKEALYDKISSIYDNIEYKRNHAQERLKAHIKKRVEIAYNIAIDIYNRKAGINSLETIKKDIISTLSKIKYKQSDYYFIQEYHNDKKLISLLNSRLTECDGKNLCESDNVFVREYAKKLLSLLKDKREGFLKYDYYSEDSQNIATDKISYVKIIEPLNLIIGYGEYKRNIKKEIQDEILMRLNALKFSNNNGYIYTVDYNYKLLQHTKYSNKVGTDFSKVDENKYSAQVIQDFILQNNGINETNREKTIFSEPNETQEEHRISILKYIPDWDWIIVGKVCVRNLEKNIEDMVGMKKAQYYEGLIHMLIITLLLVICVSVISFFISRKVSRIFKSYKQNIESQKNALKNINLMLESKIAQKTHELEKLNTQLKREVNAEVKKNREKDQILYHQSKMASMGEMIGNIAHQWRQPLSTISTAASGMGLKIDYDIFDKDMAKEDIHLIVNTTKYLSETIDDFRNFFAEEKKMENTDLAAILKNSINLISASMKNNHIEIIENMEPIFVNVIKNELSQGILNILTNAKDVLSDKKGNKERRLIFIDLSSDKNNAYINIKDNGKGIPRDIVEKIYEPYFTTKHKSQGTGIGLYMTREIIVKHLNGDIETNNVTYEYEGEMHTGANFKITLPLNLPKS